MLRIKGRVHTVAMCIHISRIIYTCITYIHIYTSIAYIAYTRVRYIPHTRVRSIPHRFIVYSQYTRLSQIQFTIWQDSNFHHSQVLVPRCHSSVYSELCSMEHKGPRCIHAQDSKGDVRSQPVGGPFVYLVGGSLWRKIPGYFELPLQLHLRD